jgi:hypothetical protein
VLCNGKGRQSIIEFESGRSVHFLRAPKPVDSSVSLVSLQQVVYHPEGLDCAIFSGDSSRENSVP